MTGLIWILVAIAVAVILSPLIFRLARSWHKGTAALVAGSAVGGAVGDTSIGSYITRLRTGSDSDRGDSADSDSSDVDSTPSDSSSASDSD